MSLEEDRELIEKITSAPAKLVDAKRKTLGQLGKKLKSVGLTEVKMDEEEDGVLGNLCQWTTSDDNVFIPASTTRNMLPPGAYEICMSPSSGIYFEKVTVKTTDLVKFPDSNSDRVIDEIKLFWTSKDKFSQFKMPYKRGICLWGPPGCHAKGTKVVLHDGSLKCVEDVVVGDILLGPDSKPRKVLALRSGVDQMYRITPVRGESFVVNGHHILSLRKSGSRDKQFPPVFNTSVNDYLMLSKPTRQRLKLRHTSSVKYSGSGKLPLPPYFLGAWLGDGTSRDPAITTQDVEIVECVNQLAVARGLYVTKSRVTNSKARCYTIAGKGKIRNTVRDDLKDLGVLNDKHVPSAYMYASEEDRLELLAGIVDTDGSYSTVSYRPGDTKKGYKGYFDVIQVNKALAHQVASLARSLGFGVTTRECVKTIKSRGFKGTYTRLSICGDIHKIPVRLNRKKANVGSPNKDWLVTGIKSVEPLGDGNYYGFTLSGDHLYMTDDYIIHHNSGKSCTVKFIMEDVIARNGIVIKFTHPELFIKGYRILREIQHDTPVVVIMEDVDSIVDDWNESSVLNILDGAIDELENVVFLATTNYPEKLGARIINRPSRFDRRFKIGFPTAEARKIYFEHLFKEFDLEQGKNIDMWVKDTEEMSIAHLRELFVAVVILENDYEEAIEILKTMDESISSDQDGGRGIGFL